MPFNLTNALTTFQRVMDQVLDQINRQFALVYIDDINVFSDTFQDHLTHLKEVFREFTKQISDLTLVNVILREKA